jgi:hypothetical protein
MPTTTFKYFPDFATEVTFDTRGCAFCGRVPALDGVWLDFGDYYDDPPPVCIDDLLADKAHVDIPRRLQQQLALAVRTRHTDWDEERVAAYVATRTAELAHTPPVPWIQENEWPICAEDYATYVGQLTRNTLIERYGSAHAAKAGLQTLMRTLRPNWDVDKAQHLQAWWDALGDFLRLYSFRCDEGAEVVVLQTM